MTRATLRLCMRTALGIGLVVAIGWIAAAAAVAGLSVDLARRGAAHLFGHAHADLAGDHEVPS